MNTITHFSRFYHKMGSITHLATFCRESRFREKLFILLSTHNCCACSSACLQHLHTCIAKNTLSEAYQRQGYPHEALALLHEMQQTDVQPDHFTFATVLPACTKMGAVKEGMNIHQSIIEGGFLSDAVVANALMDMYTKCGSIAKARELFNKMPQKNMVSWNTILAGYAQSGDLDEATRVFKEMPRRDTVSWTSMIAAYAHNGLAENALNTFKQMQLAGVKTDSTTFVSILPASAKIGDFEQGMNIHQRIIESGFSSEVVVASALIDMYAKCGSIRRAREMFEKMPQRNLFSWTAMIAGYAQNGIFEEALETFIQMKMAGLKPDSTTFSSVLPACAKMGALKQGMDIHRNIIQSGLLSDVLVASALVDMYAKCGSIHKARHLFNEVSKQDTVLWNAMISGYAMHGYGKDALKLFELMKQAGIYPDHVTFVGILFATSHAGLVDKGCKYFNDMSDPYCIMPTMDHYVCMVDLIGRAGYLEKAFNFIIKMPIQPAVILWMCLLGACKLHKDIRLGLFTATLVFELDPKNAAPYVLLSDIYAKGDRWDDVQKIRKLIKDKDIKKIPGCSWIEVHKSVHAFCAGDRSHPQTREIYAELEKLSLAMKAGGYFPDSRHVLNDVEEEEGEMFLCHHSEKLAIAFGLLNTSPGTTIRVVKNLRVCIDCHTATKFISKVVAREIIVRDANRFHHFTHGQCSCGDYW
ncbi:pentatricopeptide repeat-containing protein At4g21065 [Cryptomeria japonica]|uniref:pentatricopeptide repeat-containing protein At4g21065 n=1 Tax=Cryptomeria japonica TaxID=3369 RepID=UPI0027DAA74E|nr:pentatricopeptide repeat-containing protein At4g21065 [Cryptomeria japonica]